MHAGKTYTSDLKLSELEVIPKGTGLLSSIEKIKDISWPIERIFFISSKSKEERGNHAHIICKQFFVCVSGVIRLFCNDGESEKEFILIGLDKALYVPPGIWVKIIMESDSAIAVITDQKYDELDYIRNWEKFLEYRANL